MTATRSIDFKTIAVHVTRLVVLGGLLLVALAGCGKDDRSANVQRGRFRQVSNRRPMPPGPARRIDAPPMRGPFR